MKRAYSHVGDGGRAKKFADIPKLQKLSSGFIVLQSSPCKGREAKRLQYVD